MITQMLPSMGIEVAENCDQISVGLFRSSPTLGPKLAFPNITQQSDAPVRPVAPGPQPVANTSPSSLCPQPPVDQRSPLEMQDPITEPIRMPRFAPPHLADEFPVEENSNQLARQQIPDYQEFPVECFPEPVQRFILAQARTRNCDPAAVAVPVLSVLASAVGTRQIQIKQAWTEPAIVWTALIANGQTCHDAILYAATEPLHKRQSRSSQRQQQAWPEYEQCLARYRAEVRRAKRDAEIEPVRPEAPLAERTVAADWTIPSLARLLRQQVNGLLVCSNELDGWLGRSLGNGCRASLDRQVWSDLHAGRSVTIETRASRPSIPIERAAVSLTGSLSEELLSEKLTKASGPCGLASKLLFAFPPALPQQWTDDDVTAAVTDGYAAVVERMFTLNGVAGEGAEPEAVRLSAQAKSCFIDFMDDLSEAQMALDDVLFAWSSNLAGQAARLALVLHLARWGAGEDVIPQLCDLASMERGVALARWFAYEAQRVVINLSLQAELRDEAKLIDWLRRRQGKATPRDLCRSNSRKYPTLESAVNAFNKLVGTGITNWMPKESGPQGGRPTRQVVVAPTGETIDPRDWQEFREFQQFQREVIQDRIRAMATEHPEQIYPAPGVGQTTEKKSSQEATEETETGNHGADTAAVWNWWNTTATDGSNTDSPRVSSGAGVTVVDGRIGVGRTD